MGWVCYSPDNELLGFLLQWGSYFKYRQSCMFAFWSWVGRRWGGVARCCLVAGGAAAGCCFQRAVCAVEFGCWCSCKLVRKLGPGMRRIKKGECLVAAPKYYKLCFAFWGLCWHNVYCGRSMFF